MEAYEDLLGKVAFLICSRMTGGDQGASNVQLDELAELILQDAPPPMRARLRSAPEAHLEQIVTLLRPRLYQSRFRTKFQQLVGLSVSVSDNRMTNIFISYHRTSSSDLARHIAERLRSVEGFGVFIDQRILGPGQFSPKIEAAVKACHVFLLIVHDHFAERLSDPNDWVRREIAIALSNGKLIIPLCLRGTSLPNTLLLPPENNGLAAFNCLDFRPETQGGFDAGFNVLVDWIRKVRPGVKALRTVRTKA